MYHGMGGYDAPYGGGYGGICDGHEGGYGAFEP